MRIAVVKPDWRIRGGFEIVVERVEADLRSAGYEVDRVALDVPALPHAAFGVQVDDAVWDRAPEWFAHLAMLDHYRGLDLDGYDMVISTQPPSYAVRHPRHLAFFYHHARAFYDLEDAWIAAGRAPERLHRAAAEMLRSAEAEDLRQVTRYLAGSPRAAERLRQYGGDAVPISLYRAPGPAVAAVDDAALEHVLVVSRHEFTKRTELAVAALALGTTRGILVGGGGRQPFVQQLAGQIARGLLDPLELTDADLWLNPGVVTGGGAEGSLDRVSIAGRVDDATLDRLYRTALCVLAPAHDEDDGLTVLEAMARGRAVIVCRDGGGLTALVEDGVNGLVVEPTAVAVAAAVATLAADPALARRMGEAARATAATHTPESARRQLLEAVESVLGGAVG